MNSPQDDTQVACRRCQCQHTRKATFCPQCGMQVGSALTAEEFRGRLESVQNLYRQGALEKTEASLKFLLSHENDKERLAAVYGVLGVIYSKAQRWPDAATAYYAVTKLTPRSSAAYLKLGVACQSGGLLREAIECFYIASRLDKNNVQAKQLQEVARQERDSKVQALSAEFPELRISDDAVRTKEVCQAILALDPYHLVAGNLLTEIWENEGDFMPAMRLSKLLARKYPQATAFQERCQRLEVKVGAKAEALDRAEKARTYLQRGEFDAALLQAQAAAEAANDDLESWLTLALTLEKKNEYARSHEAFTRALKIGSSSLLAQKGAQRTRRKEFTRCREEYADAIKEIERSRIAKQYPQALQAIEDLAPRLGQDPLIPFLTGRIWCEQGNIYGGMSQFEKALESDAAFKPALLSLIALRVRQENKLSRDVNAALEEVSNLQNFANNPTALHILEEARITLTMRRRLYTKPAAIPASKMRACFLQHEAEVYTLLGRYYQEADSPSNAIEQYQALCKLQPRNTQARELWKQAITQRQKKMQAHFDMATSFRKANEFERAAQEIEKALLLEPQSAAAYLHLGAIYEYARQFDGALKVYAQALRLQSNSSEIRKRLEASQERARKMKQLQAQKKAAAAMSVARVAIRLAT